MNFVHMANAKIALLNSRNRERSFLEKRRLLLVAASEYQRLVILLENPSDDP